MNITKINKMYKTFKTYIKHLSKMKDKNESANKTYLAFTTYRELMTFLELYETLLDTPNNLYELSIQLENFLPKLKEIEESVKWR